MSVRLCVALRLMLISSGARERAAAARHVAARAGLERATSALVAIERERIALSGPPGGWAARTAVQLRLRHLERLRAAREIEMREAREALAAARAEYEVVRRRHACLEAYHA